MPSLTNELNELSELNVDFSSLEFGTIKDLDLLKNKCPCCGKTMFSLEDGKWTHLFSEAFRAAHKRDVKKGLKNKIILKNKK